ncbi:MAG: GNAT family N-acetyltransferase [Jiangellaceae bacterium]
MAVTVSPVTPERWGDLVEFFRPNGAYSNCWCAFFRVRAKDYGASMTWDPPDPGRSNREVLERLTLAGDVPGLLAYHGDEPVGWVSVAPRPQYERVLRSRTIGPDKPDETDVWSIVCFWIPARRRRQGIGTVLLDGAVSHARSRDARVLEAYPVDTAGERRPGADLYWGTVGMYRRAGFGIAAHPHSGRPVARLVVRGG